MAIIGEIAVRRARGCIGTRFVPQGRSRGQGLDCVGLVDLAYRGFLRAALPADYVQRGGRLAMIADVAERSGFRPRDDGGSGVGDLLLLRTGPAQWHLAIRSASGFIHADARLRMVVETPGPPAWAIVRTYRVEGEH